MSLNSRSRYVERMLILFTGRAVIVIELLPRLCLYRARIGHHLLVVAGYETERLHTQACIPRAQSG